jgi:hypothetical protein
MRAIPASPRAGPPTPNCEKPNFVQTSAYSSRSADLRQGRLVARPLRVGQLLRDLVGVMRRHGIPGQARGDRPPPGGDDLRVDRPGARPVALVPPCRTGRRPRRKGRSIGRGQERLDERPWFCPSPREVFVRFRPGSCCPVRLRPLEVSLEIAEMPEPRETGWRFESSRPHV